MRADHWTLKRYLTRWLVIAICAQAFLVLVPAGFFLHSSLDRELGSLLEEEIAEFTSEYRTEIADKGTNALDAFQHVATELTEEHPDFPMGWSLWGGGQQVAQKGPKRLLEKIAVQPIQLDQRQDLPGMAAWRATTLHTGEVIVVAVDGSVQRSTLMRFGLVVAFLLALGVAFALVGGVALANRFSGLLVGVSDQVRSVGTVEGDADLTIDLEGLPEEVRDVAVALQGALNRLAKETRQFRLLTAGLAHELRSPIQNLQGEIEVTLRQERDADGYRKTLESNLDEVRGLGEAVHNLMQLCVEREVVPGSLQEEFNLGFEAQLRLAGEVAQAKRKGVEVELLLYGIGATEASMDAEVWLFGDREAMLRVVRNLVGNAVQWTPSGGKVAVKIVATKHEATLTVDDSGPGIPEAMRDDIFEPFARGGARGGERVGYGLGLAIVRDAVMDHGGSVEIGTSALGGARITVTIPSGQHL
ncbi:MAG: signal transduction histidine kinase [Bacteroidia bacterium]|jgi:signal transduction histidine kinase